MNRRLIGLAAAATLLAAPALAGEPVKVGMITTLSGGGRPQVRALKVFENKKIRLIIVKP